MQNDEPYADLTSLFEAQDEGFNDEAFTERVMTPIRRRASWRAPLLFGAGGLGVGAAVSQISGLWSAVSGWVPDVAVPTASTQSLTTGVEMMSPLWIAAAGVMAISCLAIMVSERA